MINSDEIITYISLILSFINISLLLYVYIIDDNIIQYIIYIFSIFILLFITLIIYISVKKNSHSNIIIYNEYYYMRICLIILNLICYSFYIKYFLKDKSNIKKGGNFIQNEKKKSSQTSELKKGGGFGGIFDLSNSNFIHSLINTIESKNPDDNNAIDYSECTKHFPGDVPDNLSTTLNNALVFLEKEAAFYLINYNIEAVLSGELEGIFNVLILDEINKDNSALSDIEKNIKIDAKKKDYKLILYIAYILRIIKNSKIFFSKETTNKLYSILYNYFIDEIQFKKKYEINGSYGGVNKK